MKDHKSVTLMEGQDLEIRTDYTLEGDNTFITCSYPTLPKSVKPGMVILAADGTLSMEVKECRESSIIVRVCNNVTIGEKKNMNLPGVVVDLPTITEKDRDDLVNFGLKYGVDMIAASFVRKASDVVFIREVLGPAGRHIKIISKIENQEGLHVSAGDLKARSVWDGDLTVASTCAPDDYNRQLYTAGVGFSSTPRC